MWLLTVQVRPVIGANVVVKGTTNGTITDFDGNYTIEGVSANDVLVVSYIGYLSQEIPVGSQSAINVTLKEDTQTLDEVVVVGYGTMRKSDVTGSIGVAKGDDLTKNQNFSALDNFGGKVSGVNIFSNSSQPVLIQTVSLSVVWLLSTLLQILYM